MRINTTNQSFTATIVENETYKKVVQNAIEANKAGLFEQTINFINAVEAIKATDKFDTFEIQSKEPKKTFGNVSADEYFQIIIDGRPFNLGETEYPKIALGNYVIGSATRGILGFAQKYLFANIGEYVPSDAYKNYETVRVQLEQRRKEVRSLEGELSAASLKVSNEFEQKLNKLI